MRAQGTTTVEIKSGYGLTVADEERALRLAARGTTDETTFLGAHVVPAERRPARRTSTSSPGRCCAPARRTPAGSTCSASRTARTRSTATRRAPCCRRAGRPGSGCGCTATSSGRARASRLAVELGAASVDHCTHLSARRRRRAGAAAAPRWRRCCRASSSPPARPTRTPGGCSTPGVTVALATDCNPGTCYSSSMPFVIALAVREMGMTPDEALWAATAGGARALRRDDIGVIAPGAPRRPHGAGRPELPAPGLPAGGADRAGAGPVAVTSRTSSIARPRVAACSSSVSPAG